MAINLSLNLRKIMSKDKIIDKVKKLLALSESSNPNEAFLAAKRARRLMDQHSLTKKDIESAGGSGKIILTMPAE